MKRYKFLETAVVQCGNDVCCGDPCNSVGIVESEGSAVEKVA